MPHLKATLFKLLAAASLLFAAAPTVAAADRVLDAAKASDGATAAAATVDVWPDGKMPGRGAREPEGERPPKGDNLHFSAEAEKELGARFAKAMRELQKQRVSHRRL
jgi:hypothetical protein